MLKIMKDRWYKNSDKLRAELAERTDLNSCDYKTLVEIAFRNIFNTDADGYGNDLDLKHLTRVDDGDYQGTFLFVIPFNTYQPCENEYLMTYIGYGSCSSCDALQHAQNWEEGKLTEQQIDDFMDICRALICNTMRPYNYGWRHEAGFDQVDEEVAV